MSEIQKRNVPPRLLVQLSFARRRCVRDASVYFRSAVAALNVCIQSLLVLEVFEGGPGTPWPRTLWRIASPICAVHGAARVFYSNAVRCVLRARILELAWPAWL